MTELLTPEMVKSPAVTPALSTLSVPSVPMFTLSFELKAVGIPSRIHAWLLGSVFQFPIPPFQPMSGAATAKVATKAVGVLENA